MSTPPKLLKKMLLKDEKIKFKEGWGGGVSVKINLMLLCPFPASNIKKIHNLELICFHGREDYKVFL
jgi:hypothetical protein